jgi:hypothetical protein
VSAKEKSEVTRADRPPEKKRIEDAADEFVSFIDKLIKTIDADDPTEKMEYLDDKARPRSASLEKTEKKKPKPPPLPPADDTAELEVDLMDSLLPTQF